MLQKMKDDDEICKAAFYKAGIQRGVRTHRTKHAYLIATLITFMSSCICLDVLNVTLMFSVLFDVIFWYDVCCDILRHYGHPNSLICSIEPKLFDNQPQSILIFFFCLFFPVLVRFVIICLFCLFVCCTLTQPCIARPVVTYLRTGRSCQHSGAGGRARSPAPGTHPLLRVHLLHARDFG